MVFCRDQAASLHKKLCYNIPADNADIVLEIESWMLTVRRDKARYSLQLGAQPPPPPTPTPPMVKDTPGLRSIRRVWFLLGG